MQAPENIRIEAYSTSSIIKKKDPLPNSILRYNKFSTKKNSPIYPAVSTNKYVVGLTNGKLFGFLNRNISNQLADRKQASLKRPYK